MDVSAVGDTVFVAPGTYSDYEVRIVGGFQRTACVFLVDGVVLLSEAGPDVTTIDMLNGGASQPDVIYGEFLASGTTTVEGFTVTGFPVGSGAGAYLFSSEKVTFRDCVFRDSVGDGIGARLTDVDVINCRFDNLSGGAGISQSEADILIDGCEFTNCTADAVSPLGLNAGVPEQAVIRNSRFIGNSSAGNAGGVSVNNYESGAAIENCYFEGNVAALSGGALSIGGSAIGHWTVAGCVFRRNDALGSGGAGGAIRGTGDCLVTNNTFVANSSFSIGSTAIFSSGTAVFSNNVIVGSRNTEAIRQGSGGTVVPTCNVYWDNEAGNTWNFNMDATDREVDPMFCDADSGDFTVAANSPCLPAGSGGCGSIGALGEGCSPVSVESRSWGTIKGGYK